MQKLPFVRVPVLSMATIEHFAKASIDLAPLTRMPFEAPPIPAKNPRGIDITRAQGQDITRKRSPRYSHFVNCEKPRNKHGTNARRTAQATTTGVYTRAKRVMNFSVSAFFSEAFSTISMILATALSLNLHVTLTFITPSRLVQPLETALPSCAFTGRNSPVIAEVSICDSPLITIPSRGSLSPAFTMITSPISTLSGETFSSLPSLMIRANSGFSSISLEIDFRDLSTAISCKSSPTWKNSITAAASS